MLIRHSSDYDDFYVPDKQESKQNLKIAEEIIESVKEYLRDTYNIKIKNEKILT